MPTLYSSHASDKPSGGIWGIIGGLGPLASAEFLNTIYQSGGWQREQELPVIYMLSDPTYPDRTDTFDNDSDVLLLERLIDSLIKLDSLGVDRVVICCMTIHSILDQLPSILRANIIPLTDVLLSSVRASSISHLMVCTNGSRRRQLFERHPLWRQVQHQIVMPDDDDQEALHSMIYEIKLNRHTEEHSALLEHLIDKYAVNSFIAGCTELHVFLRNHSTRHLSAKCVDPLRIVAKVIAEGSSPQQGAARADARESHACSGFHEGSVPQSAEMDNNNDLPIFNKG